MKEFAEYILKALVDHPDAVRISELLGRQHLVFEARCHANDIGRIIGKNGKTISAIRHLLSAMAAKQGHKAMLEIVE